MLKGFKDFIMRGNVVDLAVAVVVATAFTAIVTAFTDNLINPLIASFGGANADGLGFYIIAGNKDTFMDFGAVITAAINFVIVAAIVYFLIVVPMNKVKAAQAARAGADEAEEEETVAIDTQLLTEIRDLLKTRNV
ncbi:large conductance mechanosensitive channel protein MscL [Corynebacterium sp. 13CS0277]|uniref:large conductance mechanosensitive channel protein MscL n=1 Tax=Corynebacterium sp. 13CS0277 TaxID=2071994 RepID=UPI000D02DBBA|nr:large conductance mechanosensitive channel protein MscL [Corynebacterium sp. 13CS0277]PRQ11040.1 large conductance mechanosensitive channel protein MscL [Corynebacterium sp. 13CS0277]